MRTFPIFLLFLENGSARAESISSTTAQMSSTTSMTSSIKTDSSTSATSPSTTSLVASSTENPQNTSDIAPTKGCPSFQNMILNILFILAPQEPIESQLDSHTSITTPTASQFEDDHQPTEATLIAKNITSRQLNTSSLPILNETSTIFEENPTETSTNSTTLTSSATTTETTVTTRPTTTTLATTRVADENANTTLSQDVSDTSITDFPDSFKTPSGRSSTSSTTTQSSGKETTTSIIFTRKYKLFFHIIRNFK